MSFDKDTNTITLDDNSDFLVDSGVLFIQMLVKASQIKNAPSRLQNDKLIVESWLNCKAENITSVEQDKIEKGWKAYIAIGLAPSMKLKKTFHHFSKQYKDEGYLFEDDAPPSKVTGVFDRMLATDEEITIKRNHDWGGEKNRLKMEAAVKNFSKRNLTFKQKLSTLSKETRIIVCSSVICFSWVVLRTADDWEILGIYLDDWEEDMFFINTGLPILVVWVAFQMYKWITSSSK